eukprot:9270974-Karenia_brevis.AAC.1
MDCMPLPVLPAFTLDTYSASPELKAGAVWVTTCDLMQCLPCIVTVHKTLLRSVGSPAQSESP